MAQYPPYCQYQAKIMQVEITRERILAGIDKIANRYLSESHKLEKFLGGEISEGSAPLADLLRKISISEDWSEEARLGYFVKVLDLLEPPISQLTAEEVKIGLGKFWHSLAGDFEAVKEIGEEGFDLTEYYDRLSMYVRRVFPRLHIVEIPTAFDLFFGRAMDFETKVEDIGTTLSQRSISDLLAVYMKIRREAVARARLALPRMEKPATAYSELKGEYLLRKMLLDSAAAPTRILKQALEAAYPLLAERARVKVPAGMESLEAATYIYSGFSENVEALKKLLCLELDPALIPEMTFLRVKLYLDNTPLKKVNGEARKWNEIVEDINGKFSIKESEIFAIISQIGQKQKIKV